MALYIYKGLERLMLVFFVPYCVNFYTLYILQWCSRFVYLQRFRKTNVSVFFAIFCIFLRYLHFTMANAIAFKCVTGVLL